MKNIAYVELDTHAEVLLNFKELISSSKQFSVDYFVSPKVAQLLNNRENIHIVEPKDLPNALNGQDYDLVIIGTLHRYFSIFKKVAQRYKTATVVHNLHFAHTHLWKMLLMMFIKIKEMRFKLKLLFFEGLISAPLLYRQMTKKMVLDKHLTLGKPLFLPTFYAKNLTERPKNSNTLTIAVPGSVSQQRRDYQHLLHKVKDFKTPTSLIFCGKASGEELQWIKNAKKEAKDHINIQYYTEKLSTEAFNELMASADVLWCPIKRETRFLGVKECYGTTKMSGNIGDAIKFCKPAIFSKDYPAKMPFIYAEKEDVEAQMYEILKKPHDFSPFQKDKVLKDLEHTLNALLL